MLVHDVIAETPSCIMVFPIVLQVLFLARFIVAVFHVIIVVVPFVHTSILSVLSRAIVSHLFLLPIPVVIGISVHM